MDDSSKKTLIIAGSSIVGFIIVVLLIIWIISLIKPKYYTYEEVEEIVLEATKEYYEANPKMLPANDGDYNLQYQALVTGEFIKPLNELLVDGASCSIEIVVTRYNDNYSYIPYLTCPGNYETKELYKQVIDNNEIKTSGTGLYVDTVNGGYYFRGEVTNNYVQLGMIKEKDKKVAVLWQIVSINSDNTIKLRAVDALEKRYTWDDRYNVEENASEGYNDFEKSRLKEKLITLATTESVLDDSLKAKLVAKELCIGKRSESDTTKDGSTECSLKTEDKMLFGLLTPYEYMRASLDENCVKAGSRSCKNYNFLGKDLSSQWTITGNADDTSKVYAFDSSKLYITKANSDKKLFLVTNLNNRVLYKSGTGTKKDPYVFR